jgi:hypothetical protein
MRTDLKELINVDKAAVIGLGLAVHEQLLMLHSCAVVICNTELEALGFVDAVETERLKEHWSSVAGAAYSIRRHVSELEEVIERTWKLYPAKSPNEQHGRHEVAEAFKKVRACRAAFDRIKSKALVVPELRRTR